MNVGALARVGLGAARYRLTGRRMPLTAFLSPTSGCDSLCRYCPMPLRPRLELETSRWLEILGELADLGTQQVVFVGGEPLRRPDIPILVAHCRTIGLWVRVETNGSRYPKLARDLDGIGHLAVSVDGDEATHDALREPGSWRRAREALDTARSRGLDRSTITVLTRENLDVEPVIRLAEKEGHLATFRLLEPDPQLEDLAPAPAALRRTLRELVEARREGRPIGMTQKTLKTLIAWPDYGVPRSPLPEEDQLCVAGQTHLFIDSDGSILPCRQLAGMPGAVSVRSTSIAEAFARLPSPDCQACAVADLTEQNHIHSLNLPALMGCAENWRRERASRLSSDG